MSSTFEEWQKAKQRQAVLAYQIAAAVAAGTTARPDDIERFQKTEAEMRELETKFSEES
ncbi:hypothetical protein [Arthrobacter sp. StoSoilB13]|uniref:hypothetical protein n=1 Tax=Arthrobacter sp. StoSoilB13 TaxID=2830993 RepID=UPI001CC62C38|nr:hypothetical protein [Arthrobacter sp. StoSoilB13]BCW47947.1 hypothetical protein StoSoilB13_02890 [Arthrobacter sp. StoSoilB13]